MIFNMFPPFFNQISLRFITIIIFFVIASGCSNLGYQQAELDSVSLPNLDYFQNVYEEDQGNQQDQRLKTYIMWLERFYFGWFLYETGWLETSEIILSKIQDPVERNVAAEKLNLVGKEVSAEWAKHNSHAIISTRTLVALGESLQEASSREEVLWFLDEVHADFLLIELGRLPESEIKIERYFPDLHADDGWDAFF